MNAKLKPILRVAGYVAFGLASLLFFFYLTFPAEAVGQRVANEIREATDGKLTFTFDDVSLYRFSGIAAEGVKIRYTPDEGEALESTIDAMTLRLRLLPLLLFDFSVSAALELGEGEIDGIITNSDDGIEFELEVDDVDFAKPPLLLKLTGIPVGGTLAGKAKGFIGLEAERKPGAAGGKELAPDRSEGAASLTIRDATFGPGPVAGFTIPAAISFGQLDLALDMRRGRARVASFQQKGGQVALDLSAGSTLRRNASTSTLETCLKLKFNDDAYLAKYPKINTALQLAQVQLTKDGEGFLHLKLGGTLGHPQRQRGLCRGGGAAGRPERPPRVTPPPPARQGAPAARPLEPDAPPTPPPEPVPPAPALPVPAPPPPEAVPAPTPDLPPPPVPAPESGELPTP